MNDDKGKVIFSLLAGATAGVVAGLLLAPETGDDTRAGLRRSASKLGHDLSQQARSTWAKVTGAPAPDAATEQATRQATRQAKSAADRLLADMDTGRPGFDDHLSRPGSDYDGTGNDVRHIGSIH